VKRKQTVARVLKNFESDRENLLDAQKYFEVLKRKVKSEKEKLGKQR